MSTASEEILARYKKVETAIDTFDREIEVGKLRPSQQVLVMKMADSQDPNVLAVFTTAASVRRIGDDRFVFPRTAGELNAMVDRLDQEGLKAAGQAFMKLNGVGDAAPDVDGEA